MHGLLIGLMLLTDWVSVIPTVVDAVPRVQIAKGGQVGICSAVIYEIDKQGFAYALTAAHCVSREPNERVDITVDERNASMLSSNVLLDLAILKFRAKNARTVPFAATEPRAGTEVAILGYGFGIEEIAMQFGHVAQSYNRETKTTWVAIDMLFGDSGGALINGQGELVGINSRIYFGGQSGQSAHMGAVVAVRAILDYIDAFRESVKETVTKK